MINPFTVPDFCWHDPPAPSEELDYYAPPCDAPSVTPPADGILVINVCDFLETICDPMPAADKMREALRLAAESVPDEGGILYFPEGVYEIATYACGPIAIKSRTWIRGAGATKTVLRWMQTSGLLLWCYAVEDVRISNIGFDINHGLCDLPNEASFNFTTAIATGAHVLEDGEIRHAKNIIVEDCDFYTSGVPVAGQTLHAVLAQGVDGLWVRRNRLRQLQIKASGGDGCTRVYLQDNAITDPFNLGISLVVQTPTGTISDAYITGNVIENLPSAGGIFVGTDGERTPGDVCERIVIRDNIIRGTFHGLYETSDYMCDGSNGGIGSSVAFILDVPKFARDWVVENNIVDNTSVEVASNTVGISIRASEDHSSIEHLVVRGNTVRHIDQYGICVAVSGRGIVVAENRCEDTRGIYVFGGALSTRDVVVRDNTITGGSSGVYASAISGSLTGLIISDNMLESLPAGGTWWVGVRLETGDVNILSASVIGNRCRAQGVFSYASWGIREEKLAGDGELIDMRYLDNDIRGATIPLELRDTRAIVRHNLGFRTEHRGTGTIAAGAYYADIAHGLGMRPRPEHIKVTATSQWGTRSLVWIEIPSDTHIRVRCAVPAVAPTEYNFAWRARIR